MPDEEAYIAAAVALAARRGVPVVATNDVRFLKPEDFESHEARVCIHEGTSARGQGPATPLHAAAVLCARPTEMAALFADVPEALANSVRDRAALQPGAEARRIAIAGLSDAAR